MEENIYKYNNWIIEGHYKNISQNANVTIIEILCAGTMSDCV